MLPIVPYVQCSVGAEHKEKHSSQKNSSREPSLASGLSGFRFLTWAPRGRGNHEKTLATQTRKSKNGPINTGVGTVLKVP